MDNIYKQLYAFQRINVDRMISLNGVCINACEMGCGKTIQTITVMKYFQNKGIVDVIITPTSLRRQWMSEFQQFDPTREIHLINDSKINTLPKSGIIIVSYGIACLIKHLLRKVKINTIVCDESHYLKNPKSKRVKSLVPILRKAKYKMLLSGTPMLSRPIELFQQLNIVLPEVVNNYYQFAFRYCNAKKTLFGIDVSGSSNEKELHEIFSKCSVRCTKDDVLKELPSKQRYEVYVPFVESEEILKIKDELKNIKDDDHKWLSNPLISKLFMETSKIKLQGIENYIRINIDQIVKTKCIFFAHHKIVLDRLSYIFNDIGIENIRIDGSTPNKKRNQNIELFKSQNGPSIAILSILACNAGLNLTHASKMYFAELYWNTSTMLQAEDRIHRVGQKNNCEYFYILGEKSFDCTMFKMLDQKLKTFQTIIDNKTDVFFLKRRRIG
jgi:SWI/SNF-related matrix-associated actin-dependent regulator 1 of chromatin subfamily A